MHHTRHESTPLRESMDRTVGHVVLYDLDLVMRPIG